MAEENKSKASLILGIIGIIAGAIMPPIGGLLALIGLIIGCVKHAKVGIILNIVAFVVVAIRTVIFLTMR